MMAAKADIAQPVENPLLTQSGDEISIRIKVSPRASISRVEGVVEGALKVRVAAPPVDGEANKELVRTLAKFFGVPKSCVTIVSGKASKNKKAVVYGVTMERAGQLLAELS